MFIHGYNVSFEGAVYRTAQIAYDLGFAGAPVLYSWASNGNLLDYPGDVSNNEWTVAHLAGFLEDLAKAQDAATIHIIAHSMGNRALVQALAKLGQALRFRQVILTAPDIDAGVFKQLADAVKLHSERVTLYVSSKDAALEASKR